MRALISPPVRDLGEFYERAVKEIRWEKTFGLKKPNNQKETDGAITRARSGTMATMIKEVKAEILTTKSPKK